MFHKLLPALFLLLVGSLSAQKMPDFNLITSPGQLKVADRQITDAEGWTHFYNSVNNELLLSVHAGAANIGSVENGLTVKSGLLGSYGSTGQDLTGADYVEDTHKWFVFNRYFQIERAAEIDTTLRLRFYFNQTDIDDVGRSIVKTEEEAKKPEDLNFFTISGISTHPFTESLQNKGGKFTLHHPPGGAAPTWYTGNFNGWKYAELRVNSLQISGGGGKYIKPFDGRYTAKGFVKTRAGEPLRGVEILNEGNIVAVTDANGFYEVGGLVQNENYKFTPRLSAQASRGVTVLDMIYLQRGLKKTKLLADPWLQIAADANYSDFLTVSDLSKMRDAILHTDTTFSGNGAWQFVTKGYEFPSYGDPFKVGVPKSQIISAIKEDRNGLDFSALKTGDLVTSDDFPNVPPLDINPVFALADMVSCGTGDTVLVDLTVKEFSRIMGFQFSIQWDEDILQFVGASDFNLAGLDESSFGFRYRNEGKLGVAWTTLTQRGTSVKDETVICRLKFLANGSNGDLTRLEFKNFPTEIEIIRDNFSAANTLLSVGSVTIDNQSPLNIIETDLRNISCAGEKDGAIDVKIAGGFGNYKYKWNTGSDKNYLTNLSGGNYRVTVYDGELCPLVSPEYTVVEPQELRMAGSQVFQISCPGAQDGRIEIRVLGGTEPYAFKWSSGAVTKDLRGLSHGEYNLTITDAQGCEDYAQFTLRNPGDVLLGLSMSDESNTGQADGAIQINNIVGGNPPYVYAWSNGGGTSKVENLAAGDYAVTILDSEGCENKLTFTVKNAAGAAVEKFTADVQPGAIKKGEPAYLTIQSPKDQSVTFKMFGNGTKQIKNESVALLRGENTHYFTAPAEEGTYLLQILPGTGGVQSMRVTVR